MHRVPRWKIGNGSKYCILPLLALADYGLHDRLAESRRGFEAHGSPWAVSLAVLANTDSHWNDGWQLESEVHALGFWLYIAPGPT